MNKKKVALVLVLVLLCSTIVFAIRIGGSVREPGATGFSAEVYSVNGPFTVAGEQEVRITFSEPITNIPTMSVGGVELEVSECNDARTEFCFNYQIPTETNEDRSIRIANAINADDILMNPDIRFSIRIRTLDSNIPVCELSGPVSNQVSDTPFDFFVVTDRDAVCKYAPQNIDYELMGATLQKTGNMHKVELNPPANDYLFFVKCKSGDYVTENPCARISFEVLEPSEPLPEPTPDQPPEPTPEPPIEPPPEANPTDGCFDSDGFDIYTKGTNFDGDSDGIDEWCEDETTVMEWICNEQGAPYPSPQLCDPGYKCEDGACMPSAATKPGTGDFNGDCVVDFEDFLAFQDAFGQGPEENIEEFDYDGDGEITFKDFVQFVGDYGKEVDDCNVRTHAQTITYCPDINGDCSVSQTDFLIFIECFNKAVEEEPRCVVGDFDTDGIVNFNDFLIFVSVFGTDLSTNEIWGPRCGCSEANEVFDQWVTGEYGDVDCSDPMALLDINNIAGSAAAIQACCSTGQMRPDLCGNSAFTLVGSGGQE